jgi:hypothetical protein
VHIPFHLYREHQCHQSSGSKAKVPDVESENCFVKPAVLILDTCDWERIEKKPKCRNDIRDTGIISLDQLEACYLHSSLFPCVCVGADRSRQKVDPPVQYRRRCAYHVLEAWTIS